MTQPDPGLSRRLGLGLLTLYGIGIIVGAGIYVLIGAVAGAAGMLAPLAFLAAGLVAAPTAATYAELCARIPEAGGAAAYVRAAFRIEALAPLAAIMIVGGATLSAAAVLQGGAGYMQALTDAPRAPLILAAAALLTAAAAIGVVESLALAAVFTLAEVAGLMFVTWAGFAAPPTAGWSAGLPAAAAGIGAAAAAASVAGATLLAFFAFVGFEDMVNMAEETVEPRRTLPKAILLSLAVTAALYAMVAAAAVRAVPVERLAASEQPLALVAEAGAGGAGGFLSAVAIAAALNGVLAQIVMGARMLYGVAHRIPALSWLAVAHPRFHTPVRTTLLVAALVTGTALAVPLVSLAATSSTILLFVFVAMNAALILLRRRGPAPPGAWTAPRWAPWAGIAGALGALAAASLGAAA
jgi:amino acid transporter